MNSLKSHPIVALILASSLAACAHKETDNKTEDQPQAVEKTKSYNLAAWPQPVSKITLDPLIEQRVADMLSNMTLEQKVAQMIQPELRSVTPEDMRRYGFGSILNGGGSFPNNNKQASIQDWVDTADAFFTASIDDSQDGSSIPYIWGTDAVHGHNNVIGATLFPHNIGLGAANNPDLIEEIAKVIAKEVAETAIDWDFSPTVAVARDDRWGRAYESFSEDPTIVRNYAGRYVEGIQGIANDTFLNQHHILATAKHFVGDGGTEKGIDQGNNLATEAQLINIHAQGYVSAIEAGVQAIMASFNAWHGEKLHGHDYLLNQVLKGHMGFDGLIVGDWNGHGQVVGCTNQSCAQAVNAGIDIIMVPEDWLAMYNNTIAQVKAGDISMNRIDDAVTRILRVKHRLGLFDGDLASKLPSKRLHANNQGVIGSAEHKAVARQSVRESLVLLKNNNHVLPINPTSKILITGDGADNIGKQSGGWTITWQGTGNQNQDFPNGTSIYQGFKDAISLAGGAIELSDDGSYQQKPDVAIVVFGENPYAEMQGDIKSGSLEYQMVTKRDLALLNSLKQDGIAVVSVFLSGRPLWINKELNASDAFVAAWLPGSEGAGVADVLLSDNKGQVNHDFSGRLSFSWPAKPHTAPLNIGDKGYQPLFKLGYGLTYQQKIQVAQLPESFKNMPQLSAEADLVIFNQAPNFGFGLYLSDGTHSQRIGSSKETLKPTNAISYQSINRFVQEDALQITWTGNRPASFSIEQKMPINIQAYNNISGFVSFDIRLDKPVAGELTFAMQKQQQPNHTLNLTEVLQKQTTGQWQSLSIALNCFSSADNNDLVKRIWSISSDASNQLTVANIKLSAKPAKQVKNCL